MRGGRRVVDVAHPLIRSAVLDDLSPGRLCALHAAAAATVDDPERAFRHELRAHLGAHPELAAEAIRRAHARLADGWELSAVELLVLGADLLGPGPARSAAVLQASHWLLTAGDTAAAADLLATAGGAGTPLDRLVRGELALLDGDSAAAARLLEEAVADDDDLGVAARAAGLLATIAANAARADEAIAWARRALELSVRSGTDATFAMTMLVSGWALRGRSRRGRGGGRRVGRAPRCRPRPAPTCSTPAACWRCGAAGWPRPSGSSRRWSTAGAGHGSDRDERRGTRSPTAGTARAAWTRRWRWPLDTAQLLEDSGQLLSQPDGPRRRGLGARRPAASSTTPARHIAGGRAGDGGDRATSPPRCGSSPPQARVAVAAGDPSAVVEALQPLADGLRDVGLPDGHPTVARRPRRRARRARPARRRGARARGPRGARDRAAAPTSRAGARPCRRDPRRGAGRRRAGRRGVRRRPRRRTPPTQGELARARLELAAGSFERRRGRRRAAADLLDRAVGRFEQLGAAPFADRGAPGARRVRPRRRAATAGGPRPDKAEASVAALVADGRTNREVAASLVVSVKTVESHLARIYDKLGVRSRTELAIEWRPDVDTVAPLTLTAGDADPDVLTGAAKFRVPPDDSPHPVWAPLPGAGGHRVLRVRPVVGHRPRRAVAGRRGALRRVGSSCCGCWRRSSTSRTTRATRTADEIGGAR